MKQLFLLLITVCLLPSLIFAQQYETVRLNAEKSYFGENSPLPAAKYFMLSGRASTDIPYMEVEIFPGKGGENKQAIYSTTWKREIGAKSLDFNIPINLNLRPGNNYDIKINYYRTITEEEGAELEATLFNNLENYIDRAFGGSSKKITLSSSDKQVMSDLAAIVEGGMTYYRPRTAIKFGGFSDMVKDQIKELEGMKLKKGGSTIINAESRAEGRLSHREDVIENLKATVRSEVKQYMNVDMYILQDDRLIKGYPTEKMRTTLALNAGYGGAIFNLDGGEFNYGSAPYLGISLPFGRGGVAKPFWNRSSLSVGAFLMNFTDVDGNKVSGPIFKVPTYVGIGYRVYKFIKLNASAVFVEDVSGTGAVSGFSNRVEVRPMIGLSAEFNFWMDLAK